VGGCGRYLSLSLHRTGAVQGQLLSTAGRAGARGQAIFAFFPHGVLSDFRILMDGLMSGACVHVRTRASGAHWRQGVSVKRRYDAFPDVYESAPARTLAASIVFKLPFLRAAALAIACVDAGRDTAEWCLRNGSLPPPSE